jgi:ribosomal RNA assembly protein
METEEHREEIIQGQDEYSYELKIPVERVAVLIGKKGDIKKEIESLTQTDLDVDSKEGDIAIKGKDAIKLFSAREIIRAIGRGFNPDIAKRLIRQDYGFELMSIMDYANTKNDMTRLKGRVIGEEGKARRVIEELTDTHICVYGKTVGIIGSVEDIPNARWAVDSLLAGGLHRNVYKCLEKKKSDKSKKEMFGVERK